jgi:hypothetical protein
VSDASHGLNESGSSEGRPSLVREYFHTEPRKLLYLVAAFLGVLVVVTIPYVLLVGFDKWANNMSEASRMIWASYTPAAANLSAPPSLPQSAAPGMMPSPPAPYWTALMEDIVPLAPLPSAGRQYVCTHCGGLGLPVWSSNGQPHCPYCGGLMAVAPLSLREDLTFVPVYTPGSSPTLGMFWGN